MAEPIIVIGAGGFGRETLDVIEAINSNSERPRWDVLGVLDDAPAAIQLKRLARRGIPHLGGLSESAHYSSIARFVVAIGAPVPRSCVSERLDSERAKLATLIHPGAVVGSESRIGKGTIVCAGALVSTNVWFGANVHINPGAIVGHDTILGSCVSVNPGAVISGEVRIAERALIGAGAVVLQGLAIGSDATVGAGACVTRNVESGITVVGLPARPMPTSTLNLGN